MAAFLDKQKAKVNNHRIADEGAIISHSDSMKETFDKRQMTLKNNFIDLLILTIKYFNPITNFFFAYWHGYSRKTRHIIFWTYMFIVAAVSGIL